jgi:hypothetical protein
VSVFAGFPKIPRWRRQWVATEKIDGTNASVWIDVPGAPASFVAASRHRFLTLDEDNHRFAAWAHANEAVLRNHLGPGRHYGEWFGAGIQRKYGLTDKRFALFNRKLFAWLEREDVPPEHPLKACGVTVVPELFSGDDPALVFEAAQRVLIEQGSVAVPGFLEPEGLVMRHMDGAMFKWTLGGDGHKATRG